MTLLRTTFLFAVTSILLAFLSFGCCSKQTLIKSYTDNIQKIARISYLEGVIEEKTKLCNRQAKRMNLLREIIEEQRIEIEILIQERINDLDGFGN